MAKRRDRYIVTGKFFVNGKCLKNVEMIDLGPCGFAGQVTAKNGKRLPDSDLKYRKFKIADLKVAKNLGLPKSLWEHTFLAEHIPIFLTKLEAR